MTVLLTDGQYRIFNVEFSTQDVDLIGGGPMAIIGGYVNNSNTFNMVWNLKNVADDVNQFTLTNAAPSANGAYASLDKVKIGAALHGSTHADVWSILPTEGNQYWILAPSTINSSIPSGLAWSLASGEDTAKITLAEAIAEDSSQLWTFHPQAGNVGNTAMGLNDLD